MESIAQYLNVYLANNSQDISNPWDCSVTSSCSNLTCSAAAAAGSHYHYSYAISPCSGALTVELSGFTYFRHTFMRSEEVPLNNATLVNVMIRNNASQGTLGIQVNRLGNIGK